MSTALDPAVRDAAQARKAAAEARAAAGTARRGITGDRGRTPRFGTNFRAQLVDRDGKKLWQLDGHASVTDQPYPMWDEFGEFNETISTAAFTETLAADPDVAFLVNHKGVTMARTRNGSLVLDMDEVGLRSRAWLNPDRQDVRDLVVAIEDRNITEMSFAFMLQDGVWDDTYEQFTITKLDINRGDVSAVNYGANPYTSIAARSAEFLADLDRLPAGAQAAARRRLAQTAPRIPAPRGSAVALLALELELD